MPSDWRRLKYGWLLGLSMLLILCAACSETTVENGNSTEPEVQNDMTQIEQELARARTLLTSERVKSEWIEVPLQVSPETVGAVAGFGLETDEPKVYGAVYVFEAWGEGNSAPWEILEAEVPDEGARILRAGNGRLFFFGYTDISGEDGIDAKYKLSDLVTAFSGEE